MDVNKSCDSSLNTTASASYDNNLIQDVDDDLYDDEIIPDNNFEDGYENSEIIELNDTTVDEDGEEFIEDVTSTGSIRHIPSKVRGSGDISAIVSNTTTALSVKVVLKKLTSTTYNATFSGVTNCTVYYTLNGAAPTTGSTKYTKAFIYDSSKTLKYFAVKTNGECGVVLSMKLGEESTPYIVYKTPITNKKQQVYISYTLPTTSIYYTTNGSTPTTTSTKYNAPIEVNNNTDLRFISVYGSITSNVYSYRMNAVKPVVTIKNLTDVRDNYQNITVKINKPGKIYYTRNGSTPNTSCNTWNNNTKVMISIKTQVRAILIDNEGFTSSVTFYQPPKIITPPVTAIRPITTLINNVQRIQFSTNKLNCTIYYTTDGSNPLTTSTVKTAKNNDKINLNKNTRLKYYTQDDIQLYKSKVFNYTPVQHPDERPTITIFNATNIWNNGQQKIIIQSNQPGKFNITKYNQTQTPQETINNYGSFTTNTKTNIEIYTQYNNKYSKTIEYNPKNGTKTIMNYNYTIKLSKVSQYNKVFLVKGVNTESYYLDNLATTDYLYINLNDYQVSYEEAYNPHMRGVWIHKGNNLEIIFQDKMYGDINTVNAVFTANALFDNTERVYLYSNYTRLFDVFWEKKNHNDENITTIFKTLSNTFTKKETISYKSKFTYNCGDYDVLQTYLLTNNIITNEYTNQTLTYLSNYRTYGNISSNLIRTYPQDRTILTAVMTVWGYDSFIEYINNLDNITSYRSDEVLVIVGINYDRVNYIHFNDLKMGMVVNGNNSIKYDYYFKTSSNIPEIARISLNLIKPNIGVNYYSELLNLDINYNLRLKINNQTNTVKYYVVNLANEYLLMDMNTGIIQNIIIIDGFNCNGAISIPLLENDTRNNDSGNFKKSRGKICFEEECNDILQNNAVFLFNCSTDDGWAILESSGGSFIASYGVALALGIATLPVSAPVVATIAVASIIVGVALMADSHGILSGQATDEDWNKFYTDLLMVPIGLGLSKGISIAGNALFKQMTGKTISIAALETTHEIKGFLYAMNNVVSDNINYARDLIISKPVENFVNDIRGVLNV